MAAQMFELQTEKGGHTTLSCVEKPLPALGANDVLISIKSVSLNYRDLMFTGMSKKGLIPCSDCAATVASVGNAVTRVKPGDRVCSLFFAETWVSGEKPPSYNAALGSDQLPGVLRTQMVLNEGAVSKFSEHLTDEEAATLPCAGLTAWDSLVNKGKIKAGDWVLCEGTGGVSTWGVVFAKAFGAHAVVTSSSNKKLEEAKALGAEVCINYKETPEWGAKVKEMTGGGVHHVLEVAGEFAQSTIAARDGATVGMIGGIGTANLGLKDGDKDARKKAQGGGKLNMAPIMVGNRDSFEAMCAKLTETKLRPVVGERLPFAESVKAFQTMKDATVFGNICINTPAAAKL